MLTLTSGPAADRWGPLLTAILKILAGYLKPVYRRTGVKFSAGYRRTGANLTPLPFIAGSKTGANWPVEPALKGLAVVVSQDYHIRLIIRLFV